MRGYAAVAPVRSGRPLGAVPLIAALSKRPWAVGAITSLVAAIVVALRIVVAGRGNAGRLIFLGRLFATPGYRFHIPIDSKVGYDGQFYYRLALGPFHFARTWSGITLDTYSRFNRIAYSLIAWVGAGGGHASIVPWSLLVVNVLAIGILGWLGATLARSQGHGALWGLLLPAFCGLLWSLGRDLTEIVESAFLVAALVALRRRHPVWAGILLIGAVLGRETAMGVVAALLVVDMAGRIPATAAWMRRQGHRNDRDAVTLTWAWVLPLVAFVAWQVTVHYEAGSFPILDSSQSNLALPVVGFWHGFDYYALRMPSIASFFWFGELVVLVTVVVLAARTLSSSTAPPYERLAWGLYLVLAICLAKGIWLGDVGFRSLDDLYIMSSVLLVTSRGLRSPRAIRILPVLTSGAWLLVAARVVHDL